MGLKLTLIRHGQTDWNAEKRVMGRLDIPLNEKGQTQAQAFAQKMLSEPIDHLVSSPQLRAIETLQPLSTQKDMPIEIEDRLAEMRFDRWEGKVFDEIKDDLVYKERRQDKKDFDYPDVESVTSLLTRTQEVLVGWQKLTGHIVCVTHMDVLKALIVQIENKSRDVLMTFDVDHVDAKVYTFDQNVWKKQQ